MGKVYFYTLFAGAIVLMFSMLNIGSASYSSPVTLTDGGVSFGNIYSYLFDKAGIIAAAIITGIAIAYYTKSTSENYVILPFITLVLATYFDTLVAIMNNANSFPMPIKYAIFIVLAPFTFGYLLSLVEFFRGTD